MIASLTGKIESVGGESCIVDVSGVGYLVYMPLSALESLSRAEDRVKIFTHFHLREDGASLYGFLNADDRVTFEKIISVSGIGPKTALNILGTLTVQQFCEALELEDHRVLTGVTGVGLTTAQRLILELKGKVTISHAENEPGAKAYGRSSLGDAVDALISLGYPQKEALTTVEIVYSADRALTTPEIVRQALQILGRK
jgi:Holliday junction DNA helicase RuvA